MSDTAKNTLFAACRHLLKPVVRVLLRHGVTYGEFTEIAKSAYVDVAKEDFSIPGKKATDSRIAILTGLSRKQVKKMRETPAEQPQFSADSVNRATRVLSGWHQDIQFTDEKGRPAILPIEGDEASFDQLVRQYSGDMTTRAMLDELIRVGAIELIENDQVKPLSRSYIPASDNPAGIKMLGTALNDLGSTIDHNLKTPSPDDKRFQRMVLSDQLSPEALPLFQRYIEEHGQKFLEVLDDWLTAHEQPSDAKEPPVSAGFGIYLILQEATDSEKDDD